MLTRVQPANSARPGAAKTASPARETLSLLRSGGGSNYLSNSAYSSHHTAHGAAKAPPPVQHFMAEFYSQNQLDYELYLWALERHGLQAAYAPLVSQAVAFE